MLMRSSQRESYYTTMSIINWLFFFFCRLNSRRSIRGRAEDTLATYTFSTMAYREGTEGGSSGRSKTTPVRDGLTFDSKGEFWRFFFVFVFLSKLFVFFSRLSNYDFYEKLFFSTWWYRIWAVKKYCQFHLQVDYKFRVLASFFKIK
jgi:hypothetical protein